VASSANFIRWIAHFELLLRTTLADRRVINATEGGAHIEGMIPMRLADVIATEIGPGKHGAFERIARHHDAYVPACTHDEAVRAREDITGSLKALKRVAGEAKRLASGTKKDQKAVQRLKQKSAQIRTILEKVGFLTSDIANAFKSEMPAPKDTWERLRNDFASLEEAATELLPYCERASGA
jgi:hypothetical protein